VRRGRFIPSSFWAGVNGMAYLARKLPALLRYTPLPTHAPPPPRTHAPRVATRSALTAHLTTHYLPPVAHCGIIGTPVVCLISVLPGAVGRHLSLCPLFIIYLATRHAAPPYMNSMQAGRGRRRKEEEDSGGSSKRGGRWGGRDTDSSTVGGTTTMSNVMTTVDISKPLSWHATCWADRLYVFAFS